MLVGRQSTPYTNHMSKTIGTVCFIISGDKVLLAEIEYPDGRRLWNGIGGELATVDPTLKQLRWFDIAKLPYAQMHPGNEAWLPKVLSSVHR
jgi:hypothetical protein